MKEIIVNSERWGEKRILVDDEDYESLNQYKWYIYKGGHTFYAGRWPHIIMHRVLLGVTDRRRLVDHIDRNGLNNQRSNIRACNYSENSMNSKPEAGSTSRFRGITFDATRKRKWRVRIAKQGIRKFIGHFETEEEAALAYNEAAIIIHGEFASLNKVG